MNYRFTWFVRFVELVNVVDLITWCIFLTKFEVPTVRFTLVFVVDEIVETDDGTVWLLFDDEWVDRTLRLGTAGTDESGSSGPVDDGFVVGTDCCVSVEVGAEVTLAFVNKLPLFLEVVAVGMIVGQWASLFVVVDVDDSSFVEEGISEVETASPVIDWRILDFGFVIGSFISSFNNEDSK